MVSINPGNSCSEEEIMRQLQELEKSDAELVQTKASGANLEVAGATREAASFVLQGEGLIDVGMGKADVATGRVDVRAGSADFVSAAKEGIESSKAKFVEKQVEIQEKTGIQILPDNLQIVYEKVNDDGQSPLVVLDPADQQEIDGNQYQIAGIRDKGAKKAHLFEGSRAYRLQEAEKKRADDDPTYVPRRPILKDINGKDCEVREWGNPLSRKHIPLFVTAFQINRQTIQLMRQLNKLDGISKAKEERERERIQEFHNHNIEPLEEHAEQTSLKQHGRKKISSSEKARRQVAENLEQADKDSEIKHHKLKKEAAILSKLFSIKEDRKKEERQKAQIALKEHSWRPMSFSGTVESVNIQTKQSIIISNGIKV